MGHREHLVLDHIEHTPARERQRKRQHCRRQRHGPIAQQRAQNFGNAGTAGDEERFGRRKPGGEQRRDLSPAEARTIFDAVARDAEAGRIVGSLFETGDGEPVTIALYANYLDKVRDRTGVTDEDGRVQVGFDLALAPSMTETLAALREMGLEIEFTRDKQNFS